MNVLSDYSMHEASYAECQKCPIGRYSTNRIFYRGVIPADILIIGEAPTDTDLVLSKPFSGPPGRLLTKITNEAFSSDKYDTPFCKVHIGDEITLCMTYTLLCAPCEPPSFKMRQPSENEIRNCTSRLQNFYDIVAPRHVVAVGRIAEKAIKRLRCSKNANPPEYTLIPTLTSILNQGEQGTLDYKRAVSALQAINI